MDFVLLKKLLNFKKMYQVEDFLEYKRFFERDNVKVFKFLQPLKKVDILEFVENLNTVIEQPIYVVNYTLLFENWEIKIY